METVLEPHRVRGGMYGHVSIFCVIRPKMGTIDLDSTRCKVHVLKHIYNYHKLLKGRGGFYDQRRTRVP